jgi:uncharacterized protein YndB with AHSA1/START domain
MPAQPESRASTALTIDRRTHTIRFTRTFEAPRSEIFDAWTQPDQVACWWDAAGERLAICEIDLRPGGTFKFVSKGHPDMPFAGTYREISPPDRLIFDAIGAIGRVTLRDLSGQTQMVVEIACSSSEQLEQYLKMGVDVGTSQTLDNLVVHVQSRAGREQFR